MRRLREEGEDSEPHPRRGLTGAFPEPPPSAAAIPNRTIGMPAKYAMKA